MKDHNPIRRHPALVQFSKDHHFGLLLAWKIGQGLNKGVSAERISNYVIYSFNEDLRHHFREEEQLIFSKLDNDDPMRVRAEREHAAMTAQVRQLEHDKNNTELLQSFSNALNEHIRFEERTMFTHIQERLTPAALEAAFSYSGVNSAEVEAAWKDTFWTRNAGQH